MENQAPTVEPQGDQKKVWYKKWWVVLIGIFILYSIGSSSLNDAKKKADEAKINKDKPIQSVETAPQQQEKNEVELKTAEPKTPQQSLEENLRNIVKKTGSSDMSYRDIKVEKADPDRPKDSKMITVGVNVTSFLSREYLLKNTGELSASIFKAVFDVQDLKPFDVFVWYYSETTDRYGKKENSAVLTYHIDKSTYEKISWDNFDKYKLCEFLENEAKITGTFDTGCKELANIK